MEVVLHKFVLKTLGVGDGDRVVFDQPTGRGYLGIECEDIIMKSVIECRWGQSRDRRLVTRRS